MFPDYKMDNINDIDESFFKQVSMSFDSYEKAQAEFYENVDYINHIIADKKRATLLKKPFVCEIHGYDHGQWVCLDAYNVNAISWYT